MKPDSRALCHGHRLAVLASLVLPALAAALPQPRLADDAVAELSLEELGQVLVTSVTGRPLPEQEAADSIFVITAEEIRRSGVRNLPEALRLAPNLQVARLNANQWAISARGFNNSIGNKLLVLIDGRTIYSPLYSGVFWDSHELLLPDIERIEVISGPGGTLWGANAVNGVINIISRPAAATQGGLVLAEGGEASRRLAARQGGRLGDSGHWRAHAMQVERERSQLASGAERRDGLRHRQAGLRADWQHAARRLTLQGEVYDGRGDGGSNLAPELSGGHLLGRWQETAEDGGNWQLQAYADVARRHDDLIFRDRTRTLDLQFNHAPALGPQHRLLWGFGHRQARSRSEATPLVRFDPAARTLRWSHVFVQNEWLVTPRLNLTAGLKAERNVYTGTEWLPTLRASYRVADVGMAWASLSRAVRAPARLDREFYFPANPPFIIQGGPDFRSEVATVAELGWRARPLPALSYAVTAFHADYERLRAGRAGPTPVENRARGHVSGLEAWASLELNPRWRLAGGVVGLDKALQADALSPPSSVPNLGNDPRWQALLRASATPLQRLEVDLTLRHVSRLPQPVVPAYTVADLRLGWRVADALEASLFVANLGDRAVSEFDPAEASRFGRAAQLRLLWRY
jgi:iron complex outermembrane receptor protein